MCSIVDEGGTIPSRYFPYVHKCATWITSAFQRWINFNANQMFTFLHSFHSYNGLCNLSLFAHLLPCFCVSLPLFLWPSHEYIWITFCSALLWHANCNFRHVWSVRTYHAMFSGTCCDKIMHETGTNTLVHLPLGAHIMAMSAVHSRSIQVSSLFSHFMLHSYGKNISISIIFRSSFYIQYPIMTKWKHDFRNFGKYIKYKYWNITLT